MIYLEFIDWDRAIPVELFRYLSPQDQWSDPDDRKVINIGRHKGIGGHPAYLSGWRIAGFARLDAWERHFKSEEALKDVGEKAAFLGMNFDYCGLYDDLVLADLPDENLHAVEYYDLADELEDESFATAARARETGDHAGRLAAVLRRIGTLGPGPAGIVIWTFPNFESLEPFVRRRPGGEPKPYLTGLFRNIGHELM